MEMVNTFMTSDRMTRTGRIRTDVNAQPRNEEMAGFFPGVPDETLAAPVRVGAGEERLGVEVRLSVKATFTVSGRVVSPGPTGGAPFMNPEIRRRFEARGERVVVREGDAVNLNLEVITDDEIQ